jgi:N-acylneuraminate cytidylyltransferase/CMP-N,N'-diacetyllegionaminic acid synthase
MLAIIPARGGSKGFPKKNIQLFSGKPLIFWTIEAAIKSLSIDKIILSTDDEEIVKLCSEYKEVETPFLRPKELAKDSSLAVDAYIYTIDKLRKDHNLLASNYIALLPTSPLRNSNDIDGAANLFRDRKADSVIACRKLDFPREWIIDLDQTQRILKPKDERTLQNRQEQKEIYIPNGSIYILKHEMVKKFRTYYFDRTFAYLMPGNRSIDIDSKEDFSYAEYLDSGN